MKKLFALILALVMALSCTSALAGTVYTDLTVDGDVVKGLMAGFGMPEDQMGMIDPVIALVNALGVKVITVDDGAQIDLDLNGAAALSLGVASDEAGVSVVSTLFPNYYLTVSQETIAQIMEQVMANMPGAGEGGAGGLDMAAFAEIFSSYISPWMEACSAAGQPGEPVPGEYEYEGIVFDTMIPVTVDVPAIRQATRKLLDDLLADPSAMAMIKGMAQGMAQSTGAAVDDADFEAQFKAGFEAWMAHFPETVTVEYYANSDESESFYMYAESIAEGSEEPFFTTDMLFVDPQNMKMGFTMTQEEMAISAGFEMAGTDMSLSFDMGGMFFGLGLSFPENEFDLDLYFLNPDAPLLCVKVTMDEAGERTLPMDTAGKTAVAIALPMDGNDEALQGLLGDIMGNGFGALMGVLGEQVPEVAGLMSAALGMAG